MLRRLRNWIRRPEPRTIDHPQLGVLTWERGGVAGRMSPCWRGKLPWDTGHATIILDGSAEAPAPELVAAALRLKPLLADHIHAAFAALLAEVPDLPRDTHGPSAVYIEAHYGPCWLTIEFAGKWCVRFDGDQPVEVTYED